MADNDGLTGYYAKRGENVNFHQGFVEMKPYQI